MAAYAPIKIKKLKPVKDHIIVSEMAFEDRISSAGIIILNDNGKSSGVRPRWGKVFAIGPAQQDVKIGQWVLIDHGRWTRGISVEDKRGVHTIRRVDNADILMVSDHKPEDGTVKDGLSAPNN